MKLFGKKIVVLLLPIIVLSCKTINKQIPLEVRVANYWQIKESGNYTFKRSGITTSLYYEFLSVESKKQLTEKDFYSKLTAKVSNIKIDNIDYVNEKEAVVTVKYDLDFNGYKLKGVKTKEKWKMENGKWVIVINTNSNPFWRTK